MSGSSPLKWHGGKSYLAKKIIPLCPPHLHYVEPFAGGLAVLLAKDPDGISEVVNDLNRDLTEFWEVLRNDDEFPQFVRLCQATPFSEVCFRQGNYSLQLSQIEAEAGPGVQLHTHSARVHRAWMFFVHCRQSLAGRGKAFAPLSRRRTRRGMNEQAAAWLSAVEGLPEVHARLKRVVILSRDALEVIRQQDGPETLFYCDPPYLHATRSTTGEYRHEMTDEQHRVLLSVLGVGLQGKFLLSGYRSDLYDHAAVIYGWTRHDFDLPNNAAGGETKRRMTEALWCNF